VEVSFITCAGGGADDVVAGDGAAGVVVAGAQPTASASRTITETTRDRKQVLCILHILIPPQQFNLFD